MIEGDVTPSCAPLLSSGTRTNSLRLSPGHPAVKVASPISRFLFSPTPYNACDLTPGVTVQSQCATSNCRQYTPMEMESQTFQSIFYAVVLKETCQCDTSYTRPRGRRSVPERIQDKWSLAHRKRRRSLVQGRGLRTTLGPKHTRKRSYYIDHSLKRRLCRDADIGRPSV